METTPTDRHDPDRALLLALAPYQAPHRWTSIGQIASSFGLFGGVCFVMYLGLDHGVWPALLLAPLAAGALIRVFILQHDCGHGALFRSRAANDWVGRACSLLTLTPYRNWRRQHAEHHSNWNNLDRRLERGVDLYSTCLTVAEYTALPRLRRLAFRASRHPAVLFALLPPLVFLVLYRFPFDTPRDWAHERRSVYATNAALAGTYGLAGIALGFADVALVQLAVLGIAASAGVWLFFVQHQFERTAWWRGSQWSYVAASIEASLHLRLPGVLRWFTGNIGLHHVHHLNPRIPNYRLQQCHAAHARLASGPSLGLADAIRSTAVRLWDEKRAQMVRVRDAMTRAASSSSAAGGGTDV